MTTVTRLSAGYQSDDEYTSSKKKQYSREDFKDIYCINEKAIEGLEKSRSTGFLFLGCLSSYQDSPCHRSNRRLEQDSIFTACLSDRAQIQNKTTSSEDLHFNQRYVYYYHEPLYSQGSGSSRTSCVVRPRSVAGDESHISRESLYNEAKRFVWSEELSRYVETPTAPKNLYLHKKTTRYPSAPISNIKHVSFYSPDYFTRSATSSSFDDHKIRKARFELMNGGVSQERLIDGRCKTPENVKSSTTSLVGSRTSLSLCVKSQATQTETFIRAGNPSEYLSLSPRVSMKSRMISQPTQTQSPIKPDIITKVTKTPKITPQTSQETTPNIDLLGEEEEFHENLFAQQPISRSPSNKSLTSSEGSYSLTNFKFNINQIPLPTDENTEITTAILKPPSEFADENFKKKKKKSLRAKSEERYAYKTDASTQSSISLHASLHDLTTLEDDDCGIYLDAYTSGAWCYIGGGEELKTWTRHEPVARVPSGDSTEGEREFCKKFVALTHRMVHRKASGECYRRLVKNELEINKRSTLTRPANAEYGFRIHGSRPVVVSAVEIGSPAELAGLEVGDVIISVNGLHVLDSSHSDVVRIASQAEVLELELASTKDELTSSSLGIEDEEIVSSGELLKFNGLDLDFEKGKWVARHFTLTPTTLTYSKNANTPPLQIISLTKPSPLALTQHNGLLTLKRNMKPILVLTSNEAGNLNNWKETISKQISQILTNDTWIATSGRYVTMPVDCIQEPDCVGFLWKLGRRVKSWGRKYCVLKDGVMYFYGGEGESSALGATHLHGYRVQTVSVLGGKRCAFELVPPEVSMRHYWLAADEENERKRWLAALEYSIDRWINLNSHNISKF